MKALFISRNLIGDGLYISQALYAWWQSHQGWEIDMLTYNDHITCIYTRMGVPVNVIFDEPDRSQYDFVHHFDVTPAFALCSHKKIHIGEAYAELLGVELPKAQKLTENHPSHVVKPIFIPTMEALAPSEIDLVLISMFSASCASRNPVGSRPNKMLPWPTWTPLIRFLRSKFGDNSLRFLGAPTDRAEGLDISEDEYMTGIPLNRLALIMRASKCVITLDNGMAHLAGSQNARELIFYPVCLGLHYIVPYGNPRMGVVQMDPASTDPGALQGVMKQFFTSMNI